MRLQELDLDEVNSTYSAIYWDDTTHSWMQYFHLGKYRYFWPNALHEVITNLETSKCEYRVFRLDTTRTV